MSELKNNLLDVSDEKTNLLFLKNIVKKFVEERNWQNYHTPKNLAISIMIEGAELLEHFQWTFTESIILKDSSSKKDEIEEEVADIFAYLLSFCNVLNIDLSQALIKKMDKNNLKYPITDFYGKWEKPNIK